VDTTSDGKNCGACGHDCLGGACTSGQCQPIELAQYVGNLTTIFVGAQTIYATTDSGYVGRANKDGSDLKPFARPGFASAAFDGTLTAEDGERVFFSWTGGAASLQLAYCSTSGCDATVTAFGGPYTQYFAVDETDHKVFWVDYSPSQLWSASTTGTIAGTAISGSALASGSSGARLFYSQGGIFMVSNDVLERLPASGGSFAGVTSANTSLTILGANSTDLFLYDGSSIGHIPLPSGNAGAPIPLITTALQVGQDGRFAADDTSIYWANQSVQTCQIANCAATMRALPSRSVDTVMDVGVDDQAIYWGATSPDTDSAGIDGSTVWKLAK
jgi:hypothetical protein